MCVCVCNMYNVYTHVCVLGSGFAAGCWGRCHYVLVHASTTSLEIAWLTTAVCWGNCRGAGSDGDYNGKSHSSAMAARMGLGLRAA